MATMAQRKAEWMGRFEDELLKRAPQYRGKVEWDSANFFYYAGDSVAAAVDQYIENREDNAV